MAGDISWDGRATQVSAPRLDNYGSAFQPIANWAQKAVDQQNRRKEIENANKFLSERENVKNQWAREAAQAQRDFTHVENEANRGLTQAQINETAKHNRASEMNDIERIGIQRAQVENTGNYQNGMLDLRRKEVGIKERKANFDINQSIKKAEEAKTKEQQTNSILQSIFQPVKTPTVKTVTGHEFVPNKAAEEKVNNEYKQKFDKAKSSMSSILNNMHPDIKKLVESGASRDDINAKVAELIQKNNAYLSPGDKKYGYGTKPGVNRAGSNNATQSTSTVDGKELKGSRAVKKQKEIDKIKNSLSLYDQYVDGAKALTEISSEWNYNKSIVPQKKKNVYGEKIDYTGLYNARNERIAQIEQSIPYLTEAGQKAALYEIKKLQKENDGILQNIAEERKIKANGDAKVKELAIDTKEQDIEAARKIYDKLSDDNKKEVEGLTFSNWYKKKYGQGSLPNVK